MTSGILSKNLRDKTMEKRAIGYSFFKWVKNELYDQTDSPVMYFHRQVGLSENILTAISMDFTYYIYPDYKKANIIFNDIKTRKPVYAAFTGNKEELAIFKKCLKGLYKFEKNIGYHATRNPFAKRIKYDGYIYKIDYSLMPNCLDLSETKWNIK